MSAILVAGIGNIFDGDDGFGVAVVAELARRRALPPSVELADFGIRGIDLAYSLLDGYRTAILVDSMQRGEPPGTVYVIEPEPLPPTDSAAAEIGFSPHVLDPATVLRLCAQLGGQCRRIVLVACEPATFGDEEEGKMGLSPLVAAAVPVAADTVTMLAQKFSQEEVG
jgi:hydrogenase maturation protease